MLGRNKQLRQRTKTCSSCCKIMVRDLQSPKAVYVHHALACKKGTSVCKLAADVSTQPVLHPALG